MYLITPDEADTARLLARVEPLLAAGTTWLQYRNKTASDALRQEQATALQGLCAAHGVPLIVNDDPVLAKAVGAAGVHLGGTDGDIPSARALLGADHKSEREMRPTSVRAHHPELAKAYVRFTAAFKQHAVLTERLRELVASTCHCTPVSCTVETPLPLALEVPVAAEAAAAAVPAADALPVRH